MKFHNVHGSAITLTENKTIATRSDSHFCNGIVFGDQPIRSGNKVCVELSCVDSWSGALRIGLTNQDPGKLGQHEIPKFAVPSLAKKEGYWIRPISEGLTWDGARLMFYINVKGQVHLFVDNEHKGVLFTNVPTDKPLWTIFDLYGSTRAVRIVKPDEAPKEILARGPEAVQAYEAACTAGMKPVYRTRLMLVGQDGSGKTSLKRVLIGQRHNKSEGSTSGIDLSVSCSFVLGAKEKWEAVVLGDIIENEDRENQKLGALGGVEGLEEEYHQAIASNIVQELQYQKHSKSTGAPRSRTSMSSASTKEISRTATGTFMKQGSRGSQGSTKFSEVPSEMLSGMPDRVVELVQAMLEDNGSGNREGELDSVDRASKPAVEVKVILNIWDFAGQPEYYSTHQIFMTSRAVYVIVFNLCHQLTSQKKNLVSQNEELSPLGHMDFWMRSVYAHTSQNTQNNMDSAAFSPPIVMVGTHCGSLHTDPDERQKLVEEKFDEIRDFLNGKPYVQHVVTPFFAVDSSLDDTEQGQIDILRDQIEKVASQEPYMGEKIPIKWLKFEQEVSKLVKRDGLNYASYDQVREIAANLGIKKDKEVKTMLDFYHDLGVIVHYGREKGATDNLLRNTVILQPQWLVNMLNRVLSNKAPTDKWNLLKDKWQRLDDFGILEESLLDILWKDALDQKLVLLGLLEKFNLLCRKLPPLAQSKNDALNTPSTYYVPSRLCSYTENKPLYSVSEKDVTMFIDFHGFLPDGSFHRVLTRTVRWTQENGGQDPYVMYRRVARFYLDTEHDFVLEMAPSSYHRVKVVVLRVSGPEEIDNLVNQGENPANSPPSPTACAKIRNFLESCLSELHEMWMKRISYSFCVLCPCGRMCELHHAVNCTEESCLHFLNLDHCLSNKVVCCDHRRVKTSPIKKCFPEPLTLGFNGPVLPPVALDQTNGNIEKHCPSMPAWVKSAAKLLNSGDEDDDWQALAKELGYKQNKVNLFHDDLNPGLALLADWIISSGNTGLAVDMLTIYLEKIDREDIVEIIQKAQETEQEPAQVFISYQWDSQDEVKTLRDKLERSGFTCWMDIGQLGGGDQLNIKIDEGIRNCKVVIACITPKYVVSQLCNRELSLADLLRKPIIPVMFDHVMWPPPGGMALVLSQLIYINMKGVGGHGGTGIHADLNDKYQEIIQRLCLHATPDLSRYFDSDNEGDEKNSQIIEEARTPTHLETVEPQAETPEERFSPPSGVPRHLHHSDSDPSVAVSRVEQVHVTKCRVCTIL